MYNQANFKGLVVEQKEPFSIQIKQLRLNELSQGEVVVQVAYSGVNYKDGLAGTANGNIIRQYPMVPGIDLAGIVVESTDHRFQRGQKVIATGFGLGVTHSGGYSEYARIPADWLTPLPSGLTLREAMIVGTAGITSAMSIEQLEEQGAAPDKGDVLVTGATGGVGSMAVAMLAARGYSVIASTGRHDSASASLKQLGASEVIARIGDLYDSSKPLQPTSWQAAIDPVGGPALPAILSRITYGGAVALSGLTGGTQFSATVLPFILRGVKLIGIDSVYYPSEKREQLWKKISADLRKVDFEAFVDREIQLEQLPKAFDDLLQGNIVGRVLVRINGEC